MRVSVPISPGLDHAVHATDGGSHGWIIVGAAAFAAVFLRLYLAAIASVSLLIAGLVLVIAPRPAGPGPATPGLDAWR